jgi:hypothetical protein
MNDTHQPDWDPRSEVVLQDQCAAYDEMREQCPVAYSDFLRFRCRGYTLVLDFAEKPPIIGDSLKLVNS